MSTNLIEGTSIRTVVDLPLADDHGESAPAGAEGVVRKLFDDVLGGYQVDLLIDGDIKTTIAYSNQLQLIEHLTQPTAATTAQTDATEGGE